MTLDDEKNSAECMAKFSSYMEHAGQANPSFFFC